MWLLLEVPVLTHRQNECSVVLQDGESKDAYCNIRLQPRGLKNSGNLCFMNATLQVSKMAAFAGTGPANATRVFCLQHTHTNCAYLQSPEPCACA